MNIRHMEYFAALCEEKSFSAAASKLNISQPTLTQTVQKLEGAAGAPLLDRSRSPFTLTEAGEIFLESCHKIIDIQNETLSRIAEISSGGGTIRLGIAPYRAVSLLPACLKELEKLYPGIKVVVRELVTGAMLEELKKGELDLAVTIKQDYMDADFNCIPLFEEKVLVAVPGDLALRNPLLRGGAERTSPPAVNIRAFDNMDFILLGENQLLGRYFENVFVKSGLKVKNTVRCTEIETALSMANEGMGAALIISSGLERYKEKFGNLVYYSLDTALPERAVNILCGKKHKLSNAEKTLIGLMKGAENEAGNRIA